ncbi:MAG TPA: PEP-CTERM sorting domain-containing protein [Pirellulales bacterium]|jgi:hypothetical protein|nr:PEP-CTERM sorting domain-containing protein [Pirellulales bacterium]
MMRFIRIVRSASIPFSVAALLTVGLLVSPPTASAGAIAVSAFAGDADSGISASNTYTHAIDLSGGGETINGVVFTGGGNGNQPGLNYELENAPNPFGGNNSALTGGAHTLTSSFYYGGVPTETLTLSGLTPGATYLFTSYEAAFGNAGGRYNTFTDGDGASFIYDENLHGGTLVQDTFVATGSTYTIGFTLLNSGNYAGDLGDPNTTTNGDSHHFYGFTNQLVPAPEPASLVLFGLGSLGAFFCLRRR